MIVAGQAKLHVKPLMYPVAVLLGHLFILLSSPCGSCGGGVDAKTNILQLWVFNV